MYNTFKKWCAKLNEPSLYDIWASSFERLQNERGLHGMSAEYWRIWYEEVCPAYRQMTESHRKIGVGFDSLTNEVLQDMDKPIDQRTYF